MNINKLDRLIKIERQSTVFDDTGFQTDAWTEVFEVFASITPIASNENVRMRQVYANLDATFVIRWLDRDGDGICDITSKDRVSYKGETYEILAVEPVGRLESVRLYTHKTN